MKTVQPASKIFTKLMACLVIILGIVGCDQSNESIPAETPNNEPTEAPTPIQDSTKEAWNDYHIHGVDIFSQPVACIASFKQSIISLIQAPNEDTLNDSRAQLKACFQLYEHTLLFDAANADTQKKLEQTHHRLNASLEMPGFIDAIENYPFSGIVNDTSLPITKDELNRQHGLTDQSDVSIGFQVIRFLLWGEHIYNDQVLPRESDDFEPVSQWSNAEYAIGLNELDIKEHANNRRRRYLELVTLILESDLNQLATIWNKNTSAPSNKAKADRLKTHIMSKLAKAASDANESNTSVLLALLIVSNEDGSALVPTPLAKWLTLDTEEAFATLTNIETPTNNKQVALQTLLTQDN